MFTELVEREEPEATGKAISLVSVDEYPYLEDIQKLISFKIPSEIPDGFTLDPRITAPGPKKKNRSRPRNSKKIKKKEAAKED